MGVYYTWEEFKEMSRKDYFLEYKGIVFDDWVLDEECRSIWAEMCECCAEKYKEILRDELSHGGCGACSVRNCDVIGEDSDTESHYYIDFKLEDVRFIKKVKDKNVGWIKTTYSWGDEETLIECLSENAWDKMVELATKEVLVVTNENGDNVDVLFYKDEMKITLHYWSDNSYCFYTYIE